MSASIDRAGESPDKTNITMFVCCRITVGGVLLSGSEEFPGNRHEWMPRVRTETMDANEQRAMRQSDE